MQDNREHHLRMPLVALFKKFENNADSHARPMEIILSENLITIKVTV